MNSHEDTSTADVLRTVFSQSLHCAIAINLVILEYSQRLLLLLVLVLLGSRVRLLLLLLSSSQKPQHQMESRLLLDVVVSQSTSILQLLAGENQSLLVRRNAYNTSIPPKLRYEAYLPCLGS